MNAFVTLAKFDDLMLAEVICSRLCAEGFDAVLNDDMAALGVGNPLSVYGVRIVVPADQAEKAARILEQMEQASKPATLG
jgi:hypothetical protein